jgi:hypothetical protein
LAQSNQYPANAHHPQGHMMKKRRIVIGLTAIGLAAVVCLCALKPSPPAARPVRLVITGPEGQRFSGSYTADGVTNSVSALAPATLSMQARDVDFAFKREGGDGEFRVELYVGDLCRTSTTSHTKEGVRGALRYTLDDDTYGVGHFWKRSTFVSESYWAAGF